MPIESQFSGLFAFLEQIQTDPMALTILTLLTFMSILSWYLMLTKGLKLMLIIWQSWRFKRRFWQIDDLKPVIEYLQRRGAHNPYARLMQCGLNATLSYDQAVISGLEKICSHSEFITRQLQHRIADERERLHAGLMILASIASTAPFIGLLGTVLGIYSALKTISAQGSASLNTVAAPVGEALIMTAMGLGVAIPTVIFYNTLLKGHRHFLHHLEAFANELHAYFNAGIRLDQQNLQILSRIAANQER